MAQVFRHAVERGAAAGRWSTFAQPEEIAGTAAKPVEPTSLDYTYTILGSDPVHCTIINQPAKGGTTCT